MPKVGAPSIAIEAGAWSMSQSRGSNNPAYNIWRRWFAIAFALVATVRNVGMPLLITTGAMRP